MDVSSTWIMFQLVQILPHPVVDRPVHAFTHNVTGLYKISVLQHIVRQENPSFLKQAQITSGQPVDVLSLCSIHKDQVIRTRKTGQYLCCVPFQKGDL